jgi:hypothetical protein
VSREKYHIVVLNWVAQGKGGRMWITSLNSHFGEFYCGTRYAGLSTLTDLINPPKKKIPSTLSSRDRSCRVPPTQYKRRGPCFSESGQS